MDPVVIEEFPVPGARLHTETSGSGPLLLFVVGGNGDPAVYAGVAGMLVEHFTVVNYVRRGFVRSPVDGPVDDANRIAVDVEDAVALIRHHGGGPAFVFGSSSGAIVALELVTRHPELVRTAVVHEPPILELLDDPDAWSARFAGVFATYETAGLWPAMAEFAEAVGLDRSAAPPGADVPPEMAAIFARTQDNMTFWMEHEFRQYPGYHPDLDALTAVAEKIVLAGGRDSRESGSMPFLPNVALGRRLGREIVEFPGGHVGYLEHPPSSPRRSTGCSDRIGKEVLRGRAERRPVGSTAMAADYEFCTEWRVAGTIDEVKEVLGDGAALPSWWPAVYIDVDVLQEGDDKGLGTEISVFTKGWLPYTLRWILLVTEPITDTGYALTATGDFVGTGRWTFEQDGPEVVIGYDWRISVTKPLLRRLTWLLRPVFAANHRWAMARGEESLRLELRRRRAKTDADRRRVPPPPPPTTFRWLLGNRHA